VSSDGGENVAAGEALDDGQPPDPVGLSFVDLLYAVPVADLAVRISATHLAGITASGWTDIALSITLITFGWIGHHTNRQNMPGSVRERRLEFERPFTRARFLQFLVEILIVVAYFAIGTRMTLPDDQGVPLPTELWKAEWLVAIFGLYVVWDLLDIYIAVTITPREAAAIAWAKRAARGLGVTLLFLLVFGGFYLYARGHKHPHSVAGVDLLLIGLLYVYRVLQQYCILRSWPRRPAWLDALSS
jgi:hypothetical protein